jgi:hypothetical protein
MREKKTRKQIFWRKFGLRSMKSTLRASCMLAYRKCYEFMLKGKKSAPLCCVWAKRSISMRESDGSARAGCVHEKQRRERRFVVCRNIVYNFPDTKFSTTQFGGKKNVEISSLSAFVFFSKFNCVQFTNIFWFCACFLVRCACLPEKIKTKILGL